MQRKLAFCVGSWSAESTLFSWTYAKRYFLRVRPAGSRSSTYCAPQRALASADASRKGKRAFGHGL